MTKFESSELVLKKYANKNVKFFVCFLTRGYAPSWLMPRVKKQTKNLTFLLIFLKPTRLIQTNITSGGVYQQYYKFTFFLEKYLQNW